MNIALWLFESLVNGAAAFVFCTVVCPLFYFIGIRDGKRRYYSMGSTHGYQQCLNSLKEVADDGALLQISTRKPPKPSVTVKSPFDDDDDNGACFGGIRLLQTSES